MTNILIYNTDWKLHLTINDQWLPIFLKYKFTVKSINKNDLKTITNL